MAVLLEPAELLVVGDVGPDEVAADCVPGGTLGPERAVVEPLDRRVAELGPKARVEDHDIGLGIADRQRPRREVAGEGGRRQSTPDRESGAGTQDTAPGEAAAVPVDGRRPGSVDELL